MTLCKSTRARGVILDVVPHIDSTSFIISFRQFLSRRGCAYVMISDNGKNFVSKKTVKFVNGLGVDWKLNMPLAPWHGGFLRGLLEVHKLY